LIEMIARRQGFGDVLAEGSAALAEKFGVPGLSVTVKRLEVAMHDPRAFAGMAVTYALSPCGGSHMQGDMYAVDMGQCELPEIGIVAGDRFDSSEEKGRIAARQQAWRNLYNSLTMCQFQDIGVERMLAALKCVTGWDLAPEDLSKMGKRILTLKRLLNMRRGITSADDALPALMLKPLSDGGTEGKLPNVSVLLKGAYAELGWDPTTGQPTRETIAGLGLDSAAKSP
jgi:aldehyde:ferredoxin oxidoreductase